MVTKIRIMTILLQPPINSLLAVIRKVVNLTLSSVTVPQALKCAIVKPIQMKPSLDADNGMHKEVPALMLFRFHCVYQHAVSDLV